MRLGPWKHHFWVTPSNVAQWEEPTEQQVKEAASAEEVANSVLLQVQREAQPPMDIIDHHTTTPATKRASPSSSNFQNKARKGHGRVMGDVLESVDEEVASSNSEVDAAIAEIRERSKKQGRADHRH